MSFTFCGLIMGGEDGGILVFSTLSGVDNYFVIGAIAKSFIYLTSTQTGADLDPPITAYIAQSFVYLTATPSGGDNFFTFNPIPIPFIYQTSSLSGTDNYFVIF